MTLRFVQTPAIALYTGLSAAGTSAVVTPYPRDIQTNTKLVFADFGDTPTFTIDPKIPDYEEIISFTGITDNGDDTATLTGLTRNLIGQSPYTTPGTGKQHGASAVIVFSDNPQMFARLAALENDQSFTGLNTFTQLPVSTGGNASSGTQLITYAQALAMFTGGTGIINNITVAGTAGETITKDQVVYLKVSDGRWWLADADTAATDENVILGIVQGAGSAGSAITSGVLLFGLATLTAISLTANTKYYVSNTAGAFSSSAGTTEVSLGISQTTTTFVFCPRYDQQLTEDQQDALIGNNTDIAVGTGNKMVTQTGLQKQAENYAASATGNDTYVITLSPAPTSYVNGMPVRFKADVANTGPATINVNGLGAISIVTGLSTALATGDILANQVCELRYNSTGPVFELLNPASMVITPQVIPVLEQDIPYYDGATAGFASEIHIGGSQDGNVLITIASVSNVGYLTRYTKDTVSLQYVLTHTATLTPSAGVDSPFIAVTTSYVYIGYSDGGTKKIARYDIADLANQTAITISGTNWTNGNAGCSDGTNIYANHTSNTLAKYTISGTTATFDSSITYTSAGDLQSGAVATNGTSMFTSVDTGAGTNPIIIKSYPIAGGASTASVSRYFRTQAYASPSRIGFYTPKSGALGIGYAKETNDETAIEGASLKLSAIAQP